MTSKVDGKRWEMDESKFKLSDLGYGGRKIQSLESADELIIRGKEYLERLLRPVDPSYQCIAFRAGGYGIQPNDKELIGALLAAGFKIDSSIVPGMFLKSKVNQIDFRKIPSKLNYRMGQRYGIAREEERGIFEIPIAAYAESYLETLLHHLRRIKILTGHFKKIMSASKKEFSPRGRAIQRNRYFKQTVSRLLRPSLFLLEFNGPFTEVNPMVKGTSHLVESHLKESKNLFLSASCHSKNVYSPTIQTIREFWRIMVNQYGERVKTITFQEAVKMVDRETESL
jgi:hypothetical protein